MLQTSFRQIKRTPVHLIANFLAVALICTFLVIGCNLQQNAFSNLRLLKEAFNVVAISIFRGSVNREETSTDNTGTNYLPFPPYRTW